MLQITIPAKRLWDEVKEEFVYTKGAIIQLEHSLVSLAKWESKWCKSFFSKKDKTDEETLDYIRCMTITQNVSPEVYENLSKYYPKLIDQILDYIDAPMTATKFKEDKGPKKNSRETITSERVYYWMIAYNIPFECQKWHLNRLLTLIRVCDMENKPKKKKSQSEIMQEYAEINKKRREQYNTKG